MPIVSTDMSIDRQTKVIDYIGDDHGGAAPSYYTWIEFHRWIQSLADDATTAEADDELDSTDVLPSTRATDNFITLINGYSVTNAVLEHGYDGSLVWDGGDEIADGIVNFGNIGVMIQILQNGSILTDDFWNFNIGGTCTAGSSGQTLEDSGETWTTDEFVGYVVENTTDGSYGVVTSNTADTITVDQLRGGSANVFANTNTFLLSQGLNRSLSQGISHRFTIKTRTGGADIDGRVLYGLNRTYGRGYGEFKINGTARGNNVLALNDATDGNNSTAQATIAALTDVHIDWTDSTANSTGTSTAGQTVLQTTDGTQFTAGDYIMVNTDNHEYRVESIATNDLTLNRNIVNEITTGLDIYILNVGFRQIDVNNDTTNEDYMSEWDRGANTINTFYEYQKYQSADYTDHYIYGIPALTFRGITHEFTADARTGTFYAVEDVSWTAGDAGTAGTGQMFAIDSPTAGTKMWVQLLTGGAPGDNAVVTGGQSSATFTLSAAATDRSSLIKTPFIGTSTGSALDGAYGQSLQFADLSDADKVIDLTNTQITPPNTVQGEVGGLDITGGQEDHVSVTRYFGTLDANGDPARGKYRWTLATALTTDIDPTGVVDIGVSTASLPSTGYIQVVDNAGAYRRLEYTGVSGTTFTGVNDPADGVGNADFSVTNASIGNEVFQAEYMLDTALTADNATAIVIDGTIASDTPTANFALRVQDDNGRFRLLNCTTRTGSTFTVNNTDGEEDFGTINASTGSQVYIGYLDKVSASAIETFSYVYGTVDRNFAVSVRNGNSGANSPIKEYIATFTVGTNGGSTTAIRTSDT